MANNSEEILNYTDEQAWQYRLDRESYDAAVTHYAGSLANKSSDIAVVYSRLLNAEERLVPNGDYLNGSARVDDEVLVLHGLSRVLLTTEHATMQIRKSVLKEADMGTGALGEVVAQDTNSTAIIAAGRQTSDANYELDHPLKAAMSEIINLPQNRAHLSLHMLDRGRASNPSDYRGYSVMLGIGNKPSEATLALKDFLLEVGSDLDLRVGVNTPHINFDKNHKLRHNEDGTIRTVTFAAAGPNTTRTFSQILTEQIGKDDSYAAVQMEINEVLLVRQNDEVDYPSEFDRRLGAYLGYLFVRKAAESVAQL
jgi:hypothetical protein